MTFGDGLRLCGLDEVDSLMLRWREEESWPGPLGHSEDGCRQRVSRYIVEDWLVL